MVDTVKFGNNTKVLSTATVGKVGMTLPGGLGTMENGVAYRIGNIPAGSVVTGVDIIVNTAFNGTTPKADVSVGATLAADDLDISAAGLTREAVAVEVSEDTDVTFTPTLDGATIGDATVVVYFTELGTSLNLYTE